MFNSPTSESDKSSTPRARHATSDRQTLAHVEKWLAVIREITGERRIKFPD
jgi:hypothetical protein